MLDAEAGSECITDKDEIKRMKAQIENDTRKLCGEFSRPRGEGERDPPAGLRTLYKLRKQLARASELVRIARAIKGEKCPEYWLEKHKKLMRKVVPARKGETKESKEWNEKRKDKKKLIVQAEAETERLKEEIEDSQEEWKRIKMKAWQQKINTSIGDLSKWLNIGQKDRLCRSKKMGSPRRPGRKPSR